MIKEENIRIIFGLKLKQLRQKKSLSLLELSKLAKLSPSYINEIEKGKKYPKADKIVSLADVFNVGYDEMVSLKLAGPLAPLTDLLHSNIITDLPLNTFGFDLGKMVESLENSPAKVAAFISTIVEIARNYENQKERFYFAALRAYQELHNNYFDELEEGGDIFLEKFEINPKGTFDYETALSIIRKKYNYVVEDYSLEEYPELINNRYVYIPGATHIKLLLNPLLNKNQRLFVIGREIAFNILKVQKRSNISMLVEVNSFDHILNNFLATYCTAAVLINRFRLVEDMDALFANPSWDGLHFLNMLNKYQVSPEVLIHRMTGIIPKFSGVKDLFFVRFQHDLQKDRIEMTKELYLGDSRNPIADQSWHHYCRRFIGTKLLFDFKEKQINSKATEPMVGIQIAQNYDTGEEYLCITLARDLKPTENNNSSVTIGFLINPNLRKKIKFWSDPVIERTIINHTCENCALENCEERAGEPEFILKKKRADAVKSALDKLQRSHN